MKARAVVLTAIVFLALTACHRYETPAVPDWLGAKIAEMEEDSFSIGASVFQHEWKSEYYYYIHIPLSSCMYCDVYDADGNKVNWSVESIEDYVHNRKNETLLWQQNMNR